MSDLRAFITELKARFYAKLEEKNGWGKNELRNNFEQILNEVLLDTLVYQENNFIDRRSETDIYFKNGVLNE